MFRSSLGKSNLPHHSQNRPLQLLAETAPSLDNLRQLCLNKGEGLIIPVKFFTFHKEDLTLWEFFLQCIHLREGNQIVRYSQYAKVTLVDTMESGPTAKDRCTLSPVPQDLKDQQVDGDRLGFYYL